MAWPRAFVVGKTCCWLSRRERLGFRSSSLGPRSFVLWLRPDQSSGPTEAECRFDFRAPLEPAGSTRRGGHQQTDPGVRYRPGRVLGAHSQNGHSPPTDVVESVEDGLFELDQRQWGPHPETLNDVAFHDRPDLLDWRQIGRVRRPIWKDPDPMVTEPAHRQRGGVARSTVLLEE